MGDSSLRDAEIEASHGYWSLLPSLLGRLSPRRRLRRRLLRCRLLRRGPPCGRARCPVGSRPGLRLVVLLSRRLPSLALQMRGVVPPPRLSLRLAVAPLPGTSARPPPVVALGPAAAVAGAVGPRLATRLAARLGAGATPRGRLRPACGAPAPVGPRLRTLLSPGRRPRRTARLRAGARTTTLPLLARPRRPRLAPRSSAAAATSASGTTSTTLAASRSTAAASTAATSAARAGLPSRAALRRARLPSSARLAAGRCLRPGR